MLIPYSTPLALFGLTVLIYFILDSLWNTIQIIIALLTPLFIPNEETSLKRKYGPWALITGSTDGIGKAYAFELARKGINIVLVSRNEDKLKKIADEIESKHFVKTKIIVADFSQGPKATAIVKEKLGILPIDILVNNVGKNYDYPMYFSELPEKDVSDIININVGAVTFMCHAFIDDMRKRGKGAIVNISSGSELLPMPLMAVYGATKAYIRSFTAALRHENKNSGITIQHIAPFFVETKMNAFSNKLRKSIVVPNAEAYAKYAVMTLGIVNESSGYWTHGIQTFFTKMVPTWVRIYVMGFLNHNFRKDYLQGRRLFK